MKLVSKYTEISLYRDESTNEVKQAVLGKRHRELSEVHDAPSGTPVPATGMDTIFYCGPDVLSFPQWGEIPEDTYHTLTPSVPQGWEALTEASRELLVCLQFSSE